MAEVKDASGGRSVCRVYLVTEEEEMLCWEKGAVRKKSVHFRRACGILLENVRGRRRMLEPIGYIVGAMEPGRIMIDSRCAALVIAADAGVEHLKAQGIAPDWVVGDFDSLGHLPEEDNIIRHPVEKDDTDMMLAVKTALEHGCRRLVLYGGVGGHLDHTYANLQTLAYLADHGASGYLLGDGTVSTVVKNGLLRFGPEHRGRVSVFCPGEPARGVDLVGLYYPLRDATLTSGFPLGVSNSFTGQNASVSVRQGSLLVMWEEDPTHLVARLAADSERQTEGQVEMRIVPFENKYRDDMIFMVLEAKNALGRIPRLNEDLLDIPGTYLNKGDMFWLAVDSNDRVIGCIGYNSIGDSAEVKLHRLYVKCALKRRGIGTRLLHHAEEHIKTQGKTAIYVHLGGQEYFESHKFYPKHGYTEYTPSIMKKELS